MKCSLCAFVSQSQVEGALSLDLRLLVRVSLTSKAGYSSGEGVTPLQFTDKYLKQSLRALQVTTNPRSTSTNTPQTHALSSRCVNANTHRAWSGTDHQRSRYQACLSLALCCCCRCSSHADLRHTDFGLVVGERCVPPSGCKAIHKYQCLVPTNLFFPSAHKGGLLPVANSLQPQ